MRSFKKSLRYGCAVITCQLAAATAAQAARLPIDEIIVTAQKRAESLQDVPISMEVLQGDFLDDYNTSTFEDVTKLVPNFYFQPSPGYDALNIRGFGSAGANFGFEQSVSIYSDGIYAGRARQFMAPFFDVERVEVLRGPQGALLGKNTAAGAVNITTAGPTEEFEGSVTALYNFDRDGVDVSGHLAGPITDALGARLAVKVTDFDGYLYNTATGKEDPAIESTLARLTLTYDPNSWFDVTAKLEYSDSETVGDNGTGAPIGAPLPDTKADSTKFGFPLIDEMEAFNSSLTANFQIGEHTLTSVTGYSDLDAYRAVNAGHEADSFFHNQYYEEFDQFSQEIRLLSPVDQTIEYIVGAYYDVTHLDNISPTYFDQPILGATGQINIDFYRKAQTWSGFSAVTYNVTDEARIKGSLRYTKVKKFASFDETLVSGTTHPAIGSPRTFSKKLKDSTVDPTVTLEYDVTPDAMLFANYGKGYKGPGYVSATRTATLDTFTIDNEESENIEIGIRSTLFDKKLTVNLTYYNTKFTDLQVSAYDVARAQPITQNAASARSQGVEGTIMASPTDQLLLSTSFAYTDAKYLDYPGANCNAQQPATCSPATNNIAGFDLLGTPKWSGNVQAEYWTPVFDDMKLEVSSVLTFRSKYYIATDYSLDYGVQKGWAKLDARIALTGPNDLWTIAVAGKNLTDKRTIPFAYPFPAIFTSSGARIVRYYDEPRTVSLSATVNF